MNYPKNTWDQLKGLKAGTLMSALRKDGWKLDTTSGSIHTFIKAIDGENRRVQVHFHGSNKGWSSKLLKKMLAEIGWTEENLKALKLIK